MRRRPLYLTLLLNLLLATAARAGQAAAAPGDADSRLSGPAGSGYAAITYPTDTAVNLGRNADGQITGLNDTSGGSRGHPPDTRGTGAANPHPCPAGRIPRASLCSVFLRKLTRAKCRAFVPEPALSEANRCLCG